jgi:hypothetical protein
MSGTWSPGGPSNGNDTFTGSNGNDPRPAHRAATTS